MPGSPYAGLVSMPPESYVWAALAVIGGLVTILAVAFVVVFGTGSRPLGEPTPDLDHPVAVVLADRDRAAAAQGTTVALRPAVITAADMAAARACLPVARTPWNDPEWRPSW